MARDFLPIFIKLFRVDPVSRPVSAEDTRIRRLGPGHSSAVLEWASEQIAKGRVV